MGLALVHRIVADHGGTLRLDNRSPRGTVARIVLTDAVATASEDDATPRGPGATDHGTA
jgi:nitrogen fixation/metabolism regulation signal transduction histidine kinase